MNQREGIWDECRGERKLREDYIDACSRLVKCFYLKTLSFLVFMASKRSSAVSSLSRVAR